MGKGASLGQGYVILCVRVPTTSVGAEGEGSKLGTRGVRGVSWEQGEQAGDEGSKLGVMGMLYYVLGSPPPLWRQGEQAGSEGSKANVILGFRDPTTCGKKNFDDHI